MAEKNGWAIGNSGMLEKLHTCSNGESGLTYQSESIKALTDKLGKERVLADANRGWLIRQHTTIRSAGQETLTAKRKQAIAKLRENPELAKQMGIDLDSL